VRDGGAVHKNRHQDNRMAAGKSISPINSYVPINKIDL
jgi:hypothetical protein